MDTTKKLQLAGATLLVACGLAQYRLAYACGPSCPNGYAAARFGPNLPPNVPGDLTNWGTNVNIGYYSSVSSGRSGNGYLYLNAFLSNQSTALGWDTCVWAEGFEYDPSTGYLGRFLHRECYVENTTSGSTAVLSNPIGCTNGGGNVYVPGAYSCYAL